MTDSQWLVVFIGGAIVFSVGWWLAENANRKVVTINIVALEPLCHIGHAETEPGYTAIHIREGRPLRANAFLAKKLRQGRFECEVAGWDIPALGKYRRITKIIRSC